MIKVTNLQEMNHIENAALQMHIRKKAETMMQEYQVENLDDIGCFIVLEQEEFTDTSHESVLQTEPLAGCFHLYR